MRIAIGADHAGVDMKRDLAAYLAQQGHEVTDLGTHSTAPVDYPDTAEAVATAVRNGQADRGIAICGSGAGVSAAASKFPGVRAAVCHDTYTAQAGRRARRPERAVPRRPRHRPGPGPLAGRDLPRGHLRQRGTIPQAPRENRRHRGAVLARAVRRRGLRARRRPRSLRGAGRASRGRPRSLRSHRQAAARFASLAAGRAFARQAKI